MRLKRDLTFAANNATAARSHGRARVEKFCVFAVNQRFERAMIFEAEQLRGVGDFALRFLEREFDEALLDPTFMVLQRETSPSICP